MQASTGKQYLIGVGYVEEGTHEVRALIKKLNPKTVGVELPQDYLGRVQCGNSPDLYYLYPLASDLLNSGVTVIPLETPEMWEHGESLLRAIDLTKSGGRYFADMALGVLKQQTRWGMLSDYDYRVQKNKIEAAFDIMNKYPTVQEQEALLASHAEGEESRFIAKTMGGKLEAVVVDNFHAQRLRRQLSGYIYIGSF